MNYEKKQEAIAIGATHVIPAEKYGFEFDVYIKDVSEQQVNGFVVCSIYNTKRICPKWRSGYEVLAKRIKKI